MTYRRRRQFSVAATLLLLAGCSSREFGDTTGSGGNGASGSTSSASSASSTGSMGAVCGDGVREGNESCDGSDLGGATCASILGAGYFLPPGKALSCKSDCTLDTSSCTDACLLDAPGAQLDSCILQ